MGKNSREIIIIDGDRKGLKVVLGCRPAGKPAPKVLLSCKNPDFMGLIHKLEVRMVDVPAWRAALDRQYLVAYSAERPCKAKALAREKRKALVNR